MFVTLFYVYYSARGALQSSIVKILLGVDIIQVSLLNALTVKTLSKFAADDILKLFFYFSERG